MAPFSDIFREVCSFGKAHIKLGEFQRCQLQSMYIPNKIIRKQIGLSTTDPCLQAASSSHLSSPDAGLPAKPVKFVYQAEFSEGSR